MTKLKEEFEASGGVWKEWNYSNLFTLLKGRKKLSKLDLVENSNVPVYSSDTTNNGIVGYTDLESDYQVNKDIPVYVVFGDHTRTMNIVHKDFCVMDNVKVLIPNINSDKVLQYVTSAWQKSIPNMGYSRHWSCAEVATIYLPTFNGEPSYSYMEQYISLLEEEKMLQVDKFLKDSGLNDTILTAEETDALERFRKGEVKFVERKIGELFDIKKGKRLTKANMKPGMTNFLGAISNNNGIREQIEAPFTWKPNCISVNYNGSVGYSFYQEYEFYASDDVNLCYAKDWPLDKYIALYFCATFFKYSNVFNFGFKWSKEKMEESIVKVPIVSENIPDFRFMQHFISALEKVVMRGVVKYKDEALKSCSEYSNYSFDGYNGCDVAAETMPPNE